jgi:hypothetical protein
MNSDIVFYKLSVQHQKDLLQEVENERLVRQRFGGKTNYVNALGLPHRIIGEIKVWKNRNGERGREILN